MQIGRFRLRSIPAGTWYPAADARPAGPFSRVDEQGRIELVVRLLLVEAPGERILFEAGLPADLDEARRREYGVGAAIPLPERLLAEGIDPGTIDRLVLSHLHLDHAGGAFIREGGTVRAALPRARILVQAESLRAAREAMKAGEPAGPVRREEIDGLDSVGSIRLDGATTLQPGLEIRLFGGHTPGMQGLVVGQGGETLIAPSDLLPTISHLRIPGPAARSELIETALSTRAWIFLYHDPRHVAVRLGGASDRPTVREEVFF